MAQGKNGTGVSNNRMAIEEVLKYPADTGLVNKAKSEYHELLSFESRLKREDPNMFSQVSQKYKTSKIGSYTQFGQELVIEYPESKLIKLIVIVYKERQTVSCQSAMLDFATLQKARQLVLWKSETPRQNLNKTYAGPGQLQKDNKQDLMFGSDVNSFRYGGQHNYSTQSLPDGSVKINGQVFYPEEMYRQLSHRALEQSKDIITLQQDVKKFREEAKEVEELRSRLSGFASKQLTVGNPDFTDLSDKNRPINLAEKFHMIYDEEWTTALEALTHKKKGSELNNEETAIKLLMEVIKSCDSFCKNSTAKQLDIFMNLCHQCCNNPFANAFTIETVSADKTNVPGNLVTEFKNRRKTQTSECVNNAIKDYVNGPLSKMPNGTHPDVKAYAIKCIEVMWLMAIQDPPMDIAWPAEDKTFNSAHYKEYCKKGTVVKLPVWPAVFLHRDGPLMSKGYVMPK